MQCDLNWKVIPNMIYLFQTQVSREQRSQLLTFQARYYLSDDLVSVFFS